VVCSTDGHPRHSWAFSALAEPFVWVSFVICIVTAQWSVVAPLFIVGLALDLARRRAAAIKDDLAAAGLDDPAWSAAA
jgi:hypothetical protein